MCSLRNALRVSLVLSLLLTMQGCWERLIDPTGFFLGGGDDDRPSVYPSRVTQPAAKLALAIGGSAPGLDEVLFTDNAGAPRDFTGTELACTADPQIATIVPRDGFTTLAEGSGLRIIPDKPGVTAIRCTVDGEPLDDIYEVTVPPQSLIQILVAEALEALSQEATLDEETQSVIASSESPTGNALGSVIRNRINFINARDNTQLFAADQDDYDDAPPASYYDAVIFAPNQFAPTATNDEQHDLFEDAEERDWLRQEEQIAYDQAVQTAAGIYNGDIADTTTGAFAFRSPTAEEWNALVQAWSMALLIIPDGAGFSDDSFPAFAPIQILIHPDVWTDDDGRPAFIFARMRGIDDFAVVRTP